MAKYDKQKESQYAELEKDFVTYANLTTVTVLDITTDSEPFITLPSFGKGVIGKYVVTFDIEKGQSQNIVLRKSVYDKLQNVDAALKRKKGCENCQLVVVYGYRSFDIQQQLFNVEREKVEKEFPALKENEIIEIVHRRVAVPSVAGFPTGGAVDVTIYDYGKERYLDFGTGVRDFATKDNYYDSAFITEAQKSNRALLRKVMMAEDFAPYNGEWWHFSYGDKEWAYYKYQRAGGQPKKTKRGEKGAADVRDMKYLYAQKSPSQLVYVDKFRESATVERSDQVKLAVQKKGRLTEETLNILRKAGLDVAYNEGNFFGKCNNFPLDILFVRDDDIPNLVDAGAADIGVVGENVYFEYDCQSEILQKMGFGRCALAIAVPENSNIESVFDLAGKRIATSYRRSVERFFKTEGIGAKIVDISGSVEMSPKIGYADAIVDLVSTGSSLRQNNLKFLHKISDSESILIANKKAFGDQDKRATIDKLLGRINGYLDAEKYKRLTFGIATARVGKASKILAQAKLLGKSESLNDSEFCVVQAVVAKAAIWDIVEELRAVGASDIAFDDIENIM
jgi:ATP phosphoribosyltransferase